MCLCVWFLSKKFNSVFLFQVSQQQQHLYFMFPNVKCHFDPSKIYIHIIVSHVKYEIEYNLMNFLILGDKLQLIVF